jgi:4-amino-4-deoxy-L-arabinose transferase-like glycosyltransferase
MSAPATTFDTHPTAAGRGAAVLLLITALLALRILGLFLARTDLFFDEAQYWTWSRELAFGYFSKPPLIAWTIRAATEVCGESEACIRAPAPVIYALTSGVIYLCARALYGNVVALASAVVFATLPGVSFSSGQISTDVPLLLFWTLALLAWTRLLSTGKLEWAAALGLAFGAGMLAKYAMAFFIPCAALHLAVSRTARRDVSWPKLLIAGAIAATMLIPHLLWNMRSGFVTVAHTADNADWKGVPFHPGNFLAFFGSQLAIFGPILFVSLLAVAWRALRRGASEAERLLLSFSLPVLALISVQALISRAHANWAVAAYPAGVVLVTAVLLEHRFIRLFRLSLGIHAVVALALVLAPVFAPHLTLPGGLNPFERLLGWRDMAAVVRDEIKRRPYSTVLTSDREVTAELLYYLHDRSIPVREWRPGPRPRDHYQLTIPFEGAAGPVLLVSLGPERGRISGGFRTAEPVSTEAMAGGPRRPISLTRLVGFAGSPK